MTHRQARFFYGALMIAGLVGMVQVDAVMDTPVATSLLLVVVGFWAAVEFRSLCGDRVPRNVSGVGVIATVSLLLATMAMLRWPEHMRWMPAVATLAVATPVASLLWSRRKDGIVSGDLQALSLPVLGLFVVALPCAFLLGILYLPGGVSFAVVVVLSAKLNDIGGYLVGSAMGRRALCPGISPNKTCEGALGGVIFGVGGTVALVCLIDPVAAHLSWVEGLIMGAVIAPATQLGDLFESAMKRAVGIKDSGALIPAFGGVLDLIDSLIFVMPVGYAMALTWLA